MPAEICGSLTFRRKILEKQVCIAVIGFPNCWHCWLRWVSLYILSRNIWVPTACQVLAQEPECSTQDRVCSRNFINFEGTDEEIVITTAQWFSILTMHQNYPGVVLVFLNMPGPNPHRMNQFLKVGSGSLPFLMFPRWCWCSGRQDNHWNGIRCMP